MNLLNELNKVLKIDEDENFSDEARNSRLANFVRRYSEQLVSLIEQQTPSAPHLINLQAYATNPGDMSVGIYPHTVCITMHDVDIRELSEFNDWRYKTKKVLKQLQLILYGDEFAYGVQLSDECPDCGSVGEKQENGTYKCVNPNCIVNIPPDQND